MNPWTDLEYEYDPLDFHHIRANKGHVNLNQYLSRNYEKSIYWLKTH